MKGNDNQDLTRVGSGTVMGEFMRQYWLPAIRSSELKADAPPMRLMLLGEKLLAFRVSSGRAAVLDHRCPHRCASLFFGRNEHDGLRCIYHGWKFDADGKCVEMPNVAPQYDYKDKVTAKAYRTAERNGVIWVYMGSEAEAPPLPMIEATLVPEAELTIDFKQLECNFLQSLEGEIDTSHLGFLHLGNIEADQMGENDPTRFALADRTPEIKVSDAPWGTTYCGHRAAKGAGTYWRFANFLFPFWTQSPQGPFANTVRARAWVPMDDTHTMAIGFTLEQRRGRLDADEGRFAIARTCAHGFPAQHDGLVWPLSVGAQSVERLFHRSRCPAFECAVLRDRRDRCAGSGRHGIHGSDLRSLMGASWR